MGNPPVLTDRLISEARYRQNIVKKLDKGFPDKEKKVIPDNHPGETRYNNRQLQEFVRLKVRLYTNLNKNTGVRMRENIHVKDRLGCGGM